MTTPTDRGEIHLGDLARSLASLRWRDDEQAKAIAACLGFGLQAGAAPRPPTEIYDRQRYRKPMPAGAQPPSKQPVTVPRAPEPLPVLPAHRLASSLQPLPQRAPAPPEDFDWLDDEDALFLYEDETAVARQTLFPERTNRHVLSAALATLRNGGEIDVPRVVAAICRREVVPDLPRCPESTLELGCQLLLDYSSSTVPFWDDLTGLIGQVTHVVGAAATQVFSFDTRPTEAVRWTPRGERERWVSDGRPVLAATDFGVQGRSGRAEPDPAWHGLAADCAREGIPLLMLVPWPEERWPTGIGGCPELVHWSPHTSAAMIKRKVGQGHRLP